MEEPKALLSERVEDVVLRRKVTVDGSRAVLDALGDLANRHVRKTLGDEQLPGGVEDRPPHRLTIALLTFFDSHGGAGSPGRSFWAGAE